MICAHFVKAAPSPNATWLDRIVERILDARARVLCARRLDVVLRHRVLTLMVFLATIALTVGALRQDAEGLLPAGRHRPDLRRHPRLARHFVRGDEGPAAARHPRSCWPTRRSPTSAPRSAPRRSTPRSTMAGMFISLKPPPSAATSARSRSSTGCGRSCSTSAACACSCSRPRMFAPAAASRARPYQFTLWDPDLDELLKLGAARRRQGAGAAGAGRRHHRSRAERLAGQCRRSTAWPRRGSACASRTSTTRSTTRSRSGRFPPSTRSATSIA